MESILSTKLYMPKMREARIIRKSLVEKLANGILNGCSLVLISAPAGYGKTTLAIELINHMKIPASWVSLDDGDNDLTLFLSYIISSLKKSGISSNTESLVSDLNLASKQSVMAAIINDISSSPKKIILVLDDYHVISSSQVNDAVKFLISHQPPNLHILIITREDPRLPLPKLRAQSKLIEIRLEDLRFSGGETGEFFKSVMGLTLNDAAVDTISSRTEGWVAGLQLAGLSLKGCGEESIGDFVMGFSGTHRYIIDYLMEEVLERQGTDIRDFLCKTSILSRMNGGLCDAVTGLSGCRAILQHLEQSNLFIIPLDGKREWYRYHHLFADSLRAELSKDEEYALHKKAAHWLFENGYKLEAVNHGFKSGDMDLSLQLVVDTTEQMFKTAQLETLLRWMNALPEDMIRNNEILCIRKAWALFITGRIKDAVLYLRSLGEEFLQKTTPHNRGLALSLRAVILEYTTQGVFERDLISGCEKLASDALCLLESWDPISRVSTLNTLGRALEKNGKTIEAGETFRMAYSEGQKLGHSFVTTLALMNLGNSLSSLGRRKEAIELYLEYIAGMTSEFGHLLPFIGVIYINLAALYYDGSELDNANDYIIRGIDLCSSISYNWVQNSRIIKARIEYALGNMDTAINDAEKALIEAISADMPGAVLRSASALADMQLMQDGGKTADDIRLRLKSILDKYDAAVYDDAYISYIRALIYQNHIDDAINLLEKARQEMEGRQYFRSLITVDILYAIAHFISNDFDKCYAALNRAIKSAEPHEYYRLFIDEKPLIEKLFSNRKRKSCPFEERLLEYMGITKNSDETQDANPAEEKQPPSGIIKTYDFTDKLSQREIDILKLIGEGLTNEEISNTLYISKNTTQWHITHIFMKLDVKNRTQAILKAKEIGLI